MDIYIGQTRGPFLKNENVDLGASQNLSAIFKIGIFSKPFHLVKINGNITEIGKTGILEVRDTNIISLVFEQDEDSCTSVEYMGEKRKG